MLIARLQPIHAVIGGAPRIASLMASDGGAPVPRIFTGVGAPSSGTLPSGNAKYNGLNSGFLTNVKLYAGGSGYVVGNVLTLATGSGGTGTPAQITVDAIDSSGAITDWHVSTIGTYSVYPPNILGVTGGAGTGAQFQLNYPLPDLYFDFTTLTSPVFYVCTNSGSNSTSTWAMVSGGSATAGIQQLRVVSDAGDYLVCHTWDTVTEGTLKVFVAKPWKLRITCPNETYAGVSHVFTYSTDTWHRYIRTNTFGGPHENEIIRPDYVNIIGGASTNQDVIYAAPCAQPLGGNIPFTVQSVSLVNSGTGGSYAVNDILQLAGGVGTPGNIKVLTVSAGKIVTFQINNEGIYTANPTLSNNAVTKISGSGTGTGATFNVVMWPQLIDLNVDGRDWSV